MKSKLSFWSNNVPLQISKSKRNIIFVFSLLEGRHCFKEIPFKLALYYNFNGSKYEQKCSNVVLVYQTLMWGRGFLFLTISCSKFLMWYERLKFPLALSTDQSSRWAYCDCLFPSHVTFISLYLSHATLDFTSLSGLGESSMAQHVSLYINHSFVGLKFIGWRTLMREGNQLMIGSKCLSRPEYMMPALDWNWCKIGTIKNSFHRAILGGFSKKLGNLNTNLNKNTQCIKVQRMKLEVHAGFLPQIHE